MFSNFLGTLIIILQPIKIIICKINKPGYPGVPGNPGDPKKMIKILEKRNL